MMIRKIPYFVLSALILLTIVSIVLFVTRKPEPNPYFENTSLDSSNDMVDKIEEYYKIIKKESFWNDSRGTFYDGELEYEYSKEQVDQFPGYNQYRSMYDPMTQMSQILVVLKDATRLETSCLVYREGTKCKLFLRKKWIEVSMEDDAIFINYYTHITSNFLITRDEWINYEVLMDMVHDKLDVKIGINTYDLLSGYEDEVMFHYRQDAFLDLYQGSDYGNARYFHRELSNQSFFTYESISNQIKITHFDVESGTYVVYNNQDDTAFEYQKLDGYESIFYYREDPLLYRYNMKYITGWDTIKQRSDEYYNVYQNDQFVDVDLLVLVSKNGPTAYLYLDTDNMIITEDKVSLEYYQLFFDVSVTEINLIKEYYANNFEDVLVSVGLTGNVLENKILIQQKMMNEDDSDYIDD